MIKKIEGFHPDNNEFPVVAGRASSRDNVSEKSKKRKTKRVIAATREQGPYPKYAALAEAINTLPVKLADHRYRNVLEYRKSVKQRKAERNALKNEGMRYVAIPTESKMREEIKNKVAASIKEQEDALRSRIAEGIAAEKARKKAPATVKVVRFIEPKVEQPAWEFQPSTFKKAA